MTSFVRTGFAADPARRPCLPGGHSTRANVVAVTLDAKVLTVSESVSRGTRLDLSGDELAASLADHGYRVVERRVVPDGVESVAGALTELSASFAGLLVTTGGTGFSPTDLTPEASRSIIEREAPGLAEAMRAASPLGRLSRGVAGAVGQCLVLNVPGSPKGAIESFEAVVDVLPHALELLAGGAPH
jgi:molybdopterin adenylyltransferase